MTNLIKWMAAPLRESEIVSSQRSGNTVAIQLRTYLGIASPMGSSMWQRLVTAWHILRHGYRDVPDADVRLFLTHAAASELNDLLIESIYYDGNGEYLGEQFNARD